MPTVHLGPTPSWRQLPPDCILLLFEVPSLRVTSVFTGGARCVSIGDLLILGSIGARRNHFSSKFRHFQIFHLNLHDQKSLNSLGNVENKCSRACRIHFWIPLTEIYRTSLLSGNSSDRISSNPRLKGAKRICRSNSVLASTAP